MKVPVYNLLGDRVGESEISDSIFGVREKMSVLHQVVVWQEAKSRQGSHNTKGRSDVSGGGRKPWKQKHTGRARAGSTRGPLWRHGASAHGPHPHSWAVDCPKRVRKLAVRMAISNRIRNGSFGLIDLSGSAEAKTKSMADFVAKLGQQRVLIVTKNGDGTSPLALAARNMPKCDVLPEVGLNVRDILNHNFCLVDKDALPVIEARLAAGR